MKNTKKIVSLILAVCMIASLAISASAANTVDASGGTGTSSVTLSSTADGSIDGDPAATKMSVTVPTVLPIAVGTDGTVSTATDAINGCFMSGVGDTSANSIGIAYDAIVTPVSEAVTNTAIASVLFIIAWDAV